MFLFKKISSYNSTDIFLETLSKIAAVITLEKINGSTSSFVNKCQFTLQKRAFFFAQLELFFLKHCNFFNI